MDPKLPRRQQRLLEQLRAGKSVVLGLYKKCWKKEVGAEHCIKCGAIDDISHFLDCPFHAKFRKEIFGTEMPGPEVLYKQQKEVVKYAQAIGVWERKCRRADRHPVAVALCCCAAAILCSRLPHHPEV